MEIMNFCILLFLLISTSLSNPVDYKYDNYQYGEYNYQEYYDYNNQQPEDYTDDYSQELNDYFDQTLLAPPIPPPLPPMPLPTPPPTPTPMVNCEWSPWSKWSSCSKSCGCGIMKKSRYIKTKAKNGGEPCHGSDTQTHICTYLESDLPSCTGIPGLLPHHKEGPGPTPCPGGMFSPWSKYCNGRPC